MLFKSILFASALFFGSAVDPLSILSLANAPIRAGLPPDWQVRKVRGEAAPEIEVRNDGNGPFLRIQGTGRAAWFYHQLESPLKETRGSLHWSWRIVQSPTGADLRSEKTDDSPLRVYVVFGKPGLFGNSARVIFYTFGADELAGYSRASYVSDKLHIIRSGGTPDVGHWNDNMVDPFADYRKVWRRNPPPITAIGVMQDTDQTRARAVADLRKLDWIAE